MSSLGALAFCLLAVYISKAFFGTGSGQTGFIATITGWVTAPIRLVQQRLQSVLGQRLAESQHRIGVAFHDAARLAELAGNVIASHAQVTALIAQLATGGVDWRTFKKEVGAAAAAAAAAERTARGIGADVVPQIKGLGRGIEAGIRGDLGTLDRELTQLEHRVIPRLGARVGHLEHGAINLWEWVRAHPRAIASTAFAGAVAWALSRLGLGFLRCQSVGRLGKRIGCNGFKALEELLFGVIDALVIADLCQITKLLIATAESAPVQDALRGIIDGLEELMLCQGVDLPPPLEGYWTALPPAQVFSALPAA